MFISVHSWLIPENRSISIQCRLSPLAVCPWATIRRLALLCQTSLRPFPEILQTLFRLWTQLSLEPPEIRYQRELGIGMMMVLAGTRSLRMMKT